MRSIGTRLRCIAGREPGTKRCAAPQLAALAFLSLWQRLERAQARRQRAAHASRRADAGSRWRESASAQPACATGAARLEHSRRRFQPRARNARWRRRLRRPRRRASRAPNGTTTRSPTAARVASPIEIVEKLCDRYFKRDAQHSHLQDNFPGAKRAVDKAVNNSVGSARSYPQQVARSAAILSPLRSWIFYERSMVCRTGAALPLRTAIFHSSQPVCITSGGRRPQFLAVSAHFVYERGDGVDRACGEMPCRD